MNNLIILQFVYAAFFLIISLIVLTLPGYSFLKKLKFNSNNLVEKFTVSTTLGIVIFTLSAYILAALHLRFLMYLFPIFGVFTLIFYKKELISLSFNIVKKKLFFLILLLGIIAQVSVNAPSGFPYKDGIYFWSSHGHDGVWHLSLMEHLKKSDFPFQNPELAGEKLQNYHFFVDLFMSEFSRLFNFSNLDIYFRFTPILFSLLLGLSAFIFVKEWSKSENAGFWAMFFTYFAGSFGYLLYVPTHNSLGGESIFWVTQTHSILGNPPHAAAFIIITVYLFCLLKFLDKYSMKYFILCLLLGGAIIEFKVYGGILILSGLFLLGIFEFIIKRKIQVAILFLATTLLSFLIYYPNSLGSQDFLIWEPWWYIRTMVVATDRLNWLDLELRRQTYISEGNFKRVIQLETTAFLIFLFGNLGMRFLGFLTIFRFLKENIFKNSFNLFFLIITLTSFLVPVFFLQKGVAWNSIQFNQYFLLFFGFLAGIGANILIAKFKNRIFKIILIFVIIIFAIPTQIGLLWQFYSNKPLSYISYFELDALKFLNNNTESDAVVLTYPFNKYEKDKYKNPPIPIFAWYDTGYVAAFSSRKTLFSDEEQVNIMGYKVDELIKDRNEIFEANRPEIVNDLLKKLDADYIYLVWGQKFSVEENLLSIKKVYENENAKIYKISK